MILIFFLLLTSPSSYNNEESSVLLIFRELFHPIVCITLHLLEHLYLSPFTTAFNHVFPDLRASRLAPYGMVISVYENTYFNQNDGWFTNFFPC